MDWIKSGSMYPCSACSQMWMTLSLGFLQMHYPLGLFKKIERKSRPKSFIKDMAIVGAFRFATVLLGILALNYIEVSFTETVKSSAPVVTVVVSRLLLGKSCIRLMKCVQLI